MQPLPIHNYIQEVRNSMDVKKRTRDYVKHEAQFQGLPWLPTPLETYKGFLTGHQRTESEGHPFSRIGKSSEDIGGDFRTERWFPPLQTKVWELWDPNSGPNRNYTFRGPLWAANPHRFFRTETKDLSEVDWATSGFPAGPDLLDQRGATLIARTTPTSPAFSAAAAIGELREGIPSLPGKTALKSGINPKSLSDEFLNYQFGIAPTINDARKLVKAHKDSEKILAQLYRDSGKLVRRRRSLPPEVTTQTQRFEGQLPQTLTPYALNSYQVRNGPLVTTTKITRKFWFSGGYTYFFPKQEGWHRKIAELEKVYGVIPDANDLYQLTPWSWAVDWVSNTGDLVQNLTSFAQDSLVLRYGYVMCHTTVDITDEWSGQLAVRGSWTPVTLTSKSRVVIKQRRHATPYGFGLSYDGFSDRQKAIIAALGISRISR